MPTITNLLRDLRLLQLVDTVFLLVHLAKNKRINDRFKQLHPTYPLPPADLAFDAYGYVHWPRYDESGKKHAAILSSVINETLGARADASILEWGCGPARIIRHLNEFLVPPRSLTGCDFNRRSIAWCRSNFPEIQFVENELAPPLPFESNSFDAVIARSVFTHMSEAMQLAWAEELRRILKPTGVLLITTQGDFFRGLHLNQQEKTEYDQGKPVVRANVKEGLKWYSAFHPEAFVRNRLLAGMQIVMHKPGPVAEYFEQDLWVATNRSNSE